MDAHTRRTKFGKLKRLPTDRLECGRFQPRRAIDGMGLKRLAESIRSEGMLQPIFVRKARRGKFEIVAGERRWHAAKMAGLKSVPTLIGDVSDESALALALIENLHREDLNPIDQAVAVQRLATDFGMTHRTIAEMLGKSRAGVTNLLRLLELPVDVQELVASGELAMGHARALLALPQRQRESAAHRAVSGGLSVREVERMAKDIPPERTRRSETDGRPSAATPAQARAALTRRLSLRRGKTGRCHVSFSFASREELEEALAAISGLVDELEPARDEEHPQLAMDYG